ncbi:MULTISPECIES: division plane positioning ATPase MipZ [Vibrionaceae]|uniref:division plane positioning ATPase MipZ n=1 Tax=Vibrionaceae TaxID=641 RepID=UPI000DA654C0|nr:MULTISPECIES: division plane positioning ATPase MipZ [Vibrionaceae]MCD9554819.1 chromosome partitioning protein ParA [Photobacterium carnosum]
MIYVICNEKGGSGKSSIAQTLSVYLKLIKSKDPLLIDADPQRTTAEWAAERSDSDLPQIPCIELTGNITKPLQDLNTRYDSIVIDCGGADSKAMRSALAFADITLLPFRPKRRDLKVALGMSEIIETAQALNSKLKVFSCVTQTPTLPSQGYRIQAAKSLLTSLELNPLSHITRNLNGWDDADESGLSVLEWEQDPKAGEDARALFDELMEAINEK